MNLNISSIAGKHVVIMIHTFDIGGSEKQAFLLAKYLIQNQIKVTICGLQGPGKIVELCEKYNISWKIMGNPWSSNPVIRLKNLIKFSFALRSLHPDIILSYTLFPNIICAITWKLSGSRLCIWNQRDAGLEKFNSDIQRYIISKIPLFISNSKPGVVFLINSLKVNPKKIRIIFNGIEMEKPKNDRKEWRNYLKIDEMTFVACMVANVSSRKDHETLVNAWIKVIQFAKLNKINPMPVLLFAGRLDDTYHRLKKIIKDNKMENSIRFLGEVEDISGLLNAVDIGVFSSLHEGTPNGVLECMAMKLPIVASDIPSIRDIVSHHQYSYLVRPGDPRNLAEKIINLIIYPEICEHLGSINKEIIEKKYTVDQMCISTIGQIVSTLKENSQN